MTTNHLEFVIVDDAFRFLFEYATPIEKEKYIYYKYLKKLLHNKSRNAQMEAFWELFNSGGR